MNWYPQVGTGSIAQLPVTRTRKWRAITNSLESGEEVMLPDTTAGQIDWKLTYQDLGSAEAQSLSSLFTASRGQFAPFGFVDPLANLLGWSEALSQSCWQAGLLQLNAGITDPLGTQRASSLANPNTAAQMLQQTVAIPGNYVACFSAYLWSAVVGTVTLERDGTQATVNVGPFWTRAYVSGQGGSGTAQSTFSIVLATGQLIGVWGLQVETQPYPSAYKQTEVPLGIYQETYFAGDELTMTSTAPGLSSCEIALISRV
jgi:hypothetical protein